MEWRQWPIRHVWADVMHEVVHVSRRTLLQHYVIPVKVTIVHDTTVMHSEYLHPKFEDRGIRGNTQ